MLLRFESRRSRRRQQRQGLGKHCLSINQGVGICGDTGSLGGTGTGLSVDPTYGAARVEYRPADHQALGHYAVAQRSGEIAATIGALGHLASIRWSDATRYLLLHRIKVGYTISGAVTAAVEMNFRAIMVRSFTVDFTTARTLAALGVVANTNKMRANMGTSIMGANGPAICTTTVMSGQTLTADANPFAMTVFPSLVATNSTGTAVLQSVGVSGPMTTLYEHTSLNSHPIILAANEGIVIQPVTAGPASGTFALYVMWEWAEVSGY